jgi:hypothetical protein
MLRTIGRKLSHAAMALVVGLSFIPAPASAGTGRIALEIGGAGFIIGVSGGRGQLAFQGRSYPLSVGGASLGFTIGASAQKLAGTVENINRPEDIEGRYTQLTASASFGPGGKLIRLKNAKGVILSLQGVTAGFEASLALGGFRISLK